MHEFVFFTSSCGRKNRKREALIRKLLERKLKEKYSLKVVELLKEPELSREFGVLVTPSLIRLNPKPVKRLVGSFNAEEKLERALNKLIILGEHKTIHENCS